MKFEMIKNLFVQVEQKIPRRRPVQALSPW